jgi:tetratricopeptide (TPR) repeat protein
MANLNDTIARGFHELSCGDCDAAMAAAAEALLVAPADPGALTLMGRASLMAYDARPALDIFLLLSKKYEVSDTWLDLARCYVFIRREDLALGAAQQAVKLNARSIQAHLVAGEVALTLNKTDEAERSFRSALALAPDEVKAYRGLARAADIPVAGPEVDGIFRLLGAGIAAPRRAELHYALSYIFKRGGDGQRFIEHMWAANVAQRESNRATKEAFALTLRKLDEAFDDNALSKLRGLSGDHPTPLFIVGMPRSGTTLIEQVLAGNADVAAGGEIDFVRGRLADSVRRRTGQPFPSRVETLPETELALIMAPYQDLLRLIAVSRSIVTDKTPGNYHALGLLLRLFPDARAVCMRRGAMDTCFSILQQPFDERSPHTFDVELLAVAYAHHLRMLQRWREVFGARCIDVGYEEFVAAPREKGEQLAKRCGLEWSEEMLSFHKRDSAVRTFSTRQVRREVNSGSVGAWRQFEVELAPLRDALIAEGIDAD